MPANKDRPERVPINVRVHLKYPDAEAFIEGFSDNLSKQGMFVCTEDIKPPGTRVRFEYRLRDETKVLKGIGVVRWARRKEEAADNKPPGLGVQFVDLDAETELLVNHIVDRYGAGKNAPQIEPTPTPQPSDDEYVKPLTLTSIHLDNEESSALSMLDEFSELDRPAQRVEEYDYEVDDDVSNDDDAIVLQVEDESPSPDLEFDETRHVPDAHAPTSAIEAPSSDAEPDSEAEAQAYVIDLASTRPLAAILAANQLRADVRLDWKDASISSELLNIVTLLRSEGHCRLIGRRTQIPLRLNDEGGVEVDTIDGRGNFEGVLASTLEATLESWDVIAPEQARIVVPPGLPSSLASAIENPLVFSGVEDVVFVESPLTIARAHRQEAACLIVEVGEVCSRVSLLSDRDTIVSSWASLDGSGTHVETVLSEELSRRFLLEHQLDTRTDAAVQRTLREQVTLHRASDPEEVLHMQLEGVSIEATMRDVAKWLHPVNESLALVCFSVLAQHSMSAQEVSHAVFQIDTATWPGVEKVLPALLSIPCTVSTNPLTRLHGAIK